MKILIVCSQNSGKIAPFIIEQVESLRMTGIEIDYFAIKGKGWRGYLKCRKQLLNKIFEFKPQIIHAHYGLSGILANLQRKIPVITTYHGSDINSRFVYPFSRVNMIFSAYNIFVSEKNQLKSGLNKKQSLIPCGVDIELFKPLKKELARNELNLNDVKKYVLFAGDFNNSVKNSELALEATSMLKDVTLIELKGYTRSQVATLINAVDVVLMTSFTEGSPQIIKEAMACNCPIVSVPVGDVPNVIQNIQGCFLTTYDPNDVAEKLKYAIEFNKPTTGRNRIIDLGLDISTTAKQLIQVYNKLIKI